MDRVVVNAVPFNRGEYKEFLYWVMWQSGTREHLLLRSDVSVHYIYGVEVSLLPGSYDCASCCGVQYLPVRFTVRSHFLSS